MNAKSAGKTILNGIDPLQGLSKNYRQDLSVANCRLVKRPVIRTHTFVSTYERVHAGLVAGVTVFASISLILLFVIYQAKQIQRIERWRPDPLPDGQLTNTNWEIAVDIQDFSDDLIPELQKSQFTDVEIPKQFSDFISNKGGVRDASGADGLGPQKWDPRKIPTPTPYQDETDHWDLNFQAGTLQEYVELLQAMDVELAAVDIDGENIVYVKWFDGQMQVRSGKRDVENRVFFSHTRLQMKGWDQRLLRQAGVQTVEAKLPLQFYPAQFLETLEDLENMKLSAEGRKEADVKRTSFWLKPIAGGVKVEKIETEYRSK